MNELDGFTASPVQRFRTPVENGLAEMVLTYRPAVQMWFLDVTLRDVTIKNIRVCHSLNLLAQYADVIDFGLYVYPVDTVEPGLIDDFSSGRIVLNILEKFEVDLVEGGYRV